jgi:hypothetical protein
LSYRWPLVFQCSTQLILKAKLKAWIKDISDHSTCLMDECYVMSGNTVFYVLPWYRVYWYI